ncbi:hypothetical protein GCM10011351_07700 [Paraliobacillus quinghaiensis]|uniref:Tranposase n=1 Tax=Paraliobacillus quinghaiensis TaxID=470815 RepID=A0A917WS50_9BACI|nr:hypothetical protein GCM10011351_07700 [Paraliobacillus quinghaiensis]
MSTRLFSGKEIKELYKNPYVTAVSNKGITYTDEFKRIFITENEKGKFPRQVFEEHGFDIDIIGINRVESSGKRWRAAYRKNGIAGLQDTRKVKSGRPNEKELSIEEKYERLKAQNNLLKAEVELLKKIDMAERRLGKKKK